LGLEAQRGAADRAGLLALTRRDRDLEAVVLGEVGVHRPGELDLRRLAAVGDLVALLVREPVALVVDGVLAGERLTLIVGQTWS
jgi:hypothetical protein